VSHSCIQSVTQMSWREREGRWMAHCIANDRLPLILPLMLATQVAAICGGHCHTTAPQLSSREREGRLMTNCMAPFTP
jgi:hypothetical protein